MMIAVAIVILFFPTFGTAGDTLYRWEGEEIRVVKIAPMEERAVIKVRDGTLRLIKTGDVIYEGGKVLEITDGRILVEEATEEGVETIIIRLKDGKQTVERVRKVFERKPILSVPK